MKEKVVVIGLNYQGLVVSRLLGQAGYDVYSFPLPYELDRVEMRCSRYLRGKVVPYYSIEDLNEKIDSLAGVQLGG